MSFNHCDKYIDTQMQIYCEKEYQDWKLLFTIRKIQRENSKSTVFIWTGETTCKVSNSVAKGSYEAFKVIKCIDISHL